MEVILIEKIEKLGNVGDIVAVKSGFARNYLIPQDKALRATDSNKEYFQKQKKEILAKNDDIKQKAKGVFDKVDGKSVNIIRHASDEGKLYGSVMPKDIAEKISELLKISVKKSQIVLVKTIRETGLYDVKIRIHADYLAVVQVNVARSEEEAKANLKPLKPKNDAVVSDVSESSDSTHESESD